MVVPSSDRILRSSILARIGIVLILLVTTCKSIASGLEDVSSHPPLQFGVLNQQSAIRTAERWNPILGYLMSKTGIPLELKMGATVDQTDDMMGREEFDLLFTNHNFQPKYDGIYTVLARWAGMPVRSLIVVLKDTPITTVADLQGCVVAFPSDDAFLAYAVPKVEIDRAAVTIAQKFAGHQEGALSQLRARQVHAAAVNSRFLEDYVRSHPLDYRIIYQSEPFLDLPVVIHPRVAANQREALQQALIGMKGDASAAPVLRSVTPGFEAASNHDYDNVREIYKAIGK